jgi:hypothetical protein
MAAIDYSPIVQNLRQKLNLVEESSGILPFSLSNQIVPVVIADTALGYFKLKEVQILVGAGAAGTVHLFDVPEGKRWSITQVSWAASGNHCQGLLVADKDSFELYQRDIAVVWLDAGGSEIGKFDVQLSIDQLTKVYAWLDLVDGGAAHLLVVKILLFEETVGGV